MSVLVQSVPLSTVAHPSITPPASPEQQSPREHEHEHQHQQQQSRLSNALSSLLSLNAHYAYTDVLVHAQSTIPLLSSHTATPLQRLVALNQQYANTVNNNRQPAVPLITSPTPSSSSSRSSSPLTALLALNTQFAALHTRIASEPSVPLLSQQQSTPLDRLRQLNKSYATTEQHIQSQPSVPLVTIQPKYNSKLDSLRQLNGQYSQISSTILSEPSAPLLSQPHEQTLSSLLSSDSTISSSVLNVSTRAFVPFLCTCVSVCYSYCCQLHNKLSNTPSSSPLSSPLSSPSLRPSHSRRSSRRQRTSTLTCSVSVFQEPSTIVTPSIVDEEILACMTSESDEDEQHQMKLHQACLC